MASLTIRSFSRVAALLVAVVALGPACTTSPPPPPLPPNAAYKDPTRSATERAADLLGYMTLDEKLGQMTHSMRFMISVDDVSTYGYGAVNVGNANPTPNTATAWADRYDALQAKAMSTRLGIPLFVSVDAIHGAAYVGGATVFPHQIGLGATRDPALVQQIGQAVAEEMRGSGTNLEIGPCVCVVRNDRWGRTLESFGETPQLPVDMATYITGIQGGATLGDHGPAVAVMAKHYLGDGGTVDGIDEGDVVMSEQELRATHLPAYQEAVRRGAASVMVSYSSWNGTKMHVNKYLITDVLKGELGFKGFVSSDFAGVDLLDGALGFTDQELATVVNAGVDTLMTPFAPDTIAALKRDVQGGLIAQARIDDAVLRIITAKFELGLFEHPYVDRPSTATVGSSAHRELARRAVARSTVLLKNSGGVLPLAKDAPKLFVAGKSADNIGYQSGGWTVEWQGSSGPITQGTTILQGIRQTASSSTQVTYDRYGNGIDGTYSAAIAVVGETPYAEYFGDRRGDMKLDAEDLATLNRLRASGVPVVVVLVSGRPLNITAQVDQWSALLAAWLPGTEGLGVADVLFGTTPPTGRLPVSWMRDESQQPINVGDGQTPLFPFGFGLGYPAQP